MPGRIERDPHCPRAVTAASRELVGGYGGHLTDRTWLFGGGGCWLTNRDDDFKLAYGGFVFEWLAFTTISLLPLITALVLLVVAPSATVRVLGALRQWLERHAVTVGYTIALLLGIALLRNGIAGLTS